MKKWILVPVFLLGAILAILGLAQWSVVKQAANPSAFQRQDLPTANPWVKVRIDEGMFTLFAALNAAGYDRENFELSYHPVRQLVRERLAGKNFTGQSRLRAELKFVPTYNFLVWALHYGPPPEFSRLEPNWTDSGLPAFLFYGLDKDLQSFYQEMNIAALWQEVRPQYEQEAARYQEAAGQAIQAAVDYTRMPDVPLKEVIVIPNLLAAHWNGNGPTVGNTAYVVVGPTEDEPDTSLIQHEALHSIAGPLVEANMNAIDEEQGRTLFAGLKQQVPPGYGSWESLVEEQVVRAIQCRLLGAQCFQYMLQKDETEGFLLVRGLVNKLADFEQSSSTLEEYMPQLLGTVNQIEISFPEP